MSSKVVLKISNKEEILYADEASQQLLSAWGCQIGGPLPDWMRPHLAAILKSGHLEIFEIENNNRAFSFVAVPAPSTGDIYLHGQDITERKALETLKEEFINTVSHELRTPLSIIKMALANLEEGLAGPLTEAQKNVVELTQRNINRLLRIVQGLLDLSHLESGRVKVQPRKIQIVLLLKEVVHNFKELAKQKKILLEQDCSKTLPEIDIDPDLLVQVLNNLIGNALRFAKSQIVVGVVEAEEALQFSVVDDGIGIALKDSEHIFEKYFQLNRETGKESYKGVGLGLAICKEIIHLHHGKIWVESGTGKGAAFYFTLPKNHARQNLSTPPL